MDLKILKEGDTVFCIAECTVPIFVQRGDFWEQVAKLEIPKYWQGIVIESKLPYIEYKIQKIYMSSVPTGKDKSGKVIVQKYYILCKAENFRKLDKIAELLA